MTFGQLLKSRREAHGVSQADLAAGAGLHLSLLERLEQDALQPTWPQVEALARALGDDISRFQATATVTITEDSSPGLAVEGAKVIRVRESPRAAGEEAAMQQAGAQAVVEERGLRRRASRLQTAMQEEFSRRGRGILTAVSAEVGAGHHEAALKALVEGMKDALGMLAGGPHLLQEALKINAAQLPTDAARKQLHECRVTLADRCGRYDLVVDDARALLTDHGSTLLAEYRHGLQLVVANGLGMLSRREAAAAAYTALLADGSTAASTRAWAYRGLAILNGYGSEAGVENEQRAVDAFLVAGDYLQAAIGTASLAHACRFKDPDRAVALLERAIGWLPAEGADSDMLASLTHTKAAALLKAGKAEEGLKAALQAADLRRTVIGKEAEQVASLWLARFCAEAMGNTAEVERIKRLIDAALPTVRDPQALLRSRMTHLVDGGEGESPEEILREAETGGHIDSVPLLRGFVALSARDLPYERRLELVDLARQAAGDLSPNVPAEAIQQLLSAAAGQLHLDAGHDESALTNFRAALTIDPFDAVSRAGVATILVRNERWEEAAEFFRGERRLAGDVPGVLLHLGQSLLRSGHPGDAAPLLHQAKRNAPAGADYLPAIQQMLDEALDSGATMPALTPPAAPSVPLVSVQDFEAALEDFGKFIRSEKRMAFWKLEEKKHKWTEKPESLAGHLLVSFMRGRFGDSVEIAEQVGTGAGRIDVYFQFQGGLRVIVEVKMCGAPGYTESYAKDGLDQLAHYMESKATGLGYLVVFDARLRDYGKGFPAKEAVGNYVVSIRAVDVRPEIPSVRKK